jgi:hypothetical protein
MRNIEKDAAYYRAYLPDERSLGPVAILLDNIVALWLLFYLVSVIGPVPTVRDQLFAERATVSGHHR